MTIPFGIAARRAAARAGSATPSCGRCAPGCCCRGPSSPSRIMLGGWWAYEVLGWGGYWAWDPVENASFLPWLTATAALHSAMLAERKGILKGWTVTLVLATFLLTILGTFMTRSGVFNSVHSFTQCAIGPTILVFLAVALAVLGRAARARASTASRRGGHDSSRRGQRATACSSSTTCCFVLFTFTVLLGTVFPLVVEAVRGVQMSVGRPVLRPHGGAASASRCCFLMGVGPRAALGPRQRRAGAARAAAAARRRRGCCRAVGFALGVRNAVDARHARLRRLRRPGDAARAVAAGAPAHAARTARACAQALVEAQLRRGRRRFGRLRRARGRALIVIVAIAVSSTMGVSTRGAAARAARRRRSAPTRSPSSRRETGARAAPRVAGGHASRCKRDGRDLGVLQPAHEPVRRRSASRSARPRCARSLFEDLYLSVMNIDPDGGTLGLLAHGQPDGRLDLGRHRGHGAGGLVALVPVAARARSRRARAVDGSLEPAPGRGSPRA